MGAMEMKNRIVAFLMLTLILMACAYSIFYNYGREVEDWRSTVEFVKNNWRDGDGIVFDENYVWMPFKYYGDRQGFMFQTSNENIFHFQRIWLILSHKRPDQSQLKAMLDNNLIQLESATFRGVQVYLYAVA
jgi:hypothetical protein